MGVCLCTIGHRICTVRLELQCAFVLAADYHQQNWTLVLDFIPMSSSSFIKTTESSKQLNSIKQIL